MNRTFHLWIILIASVAMSGEPGLADAASVALPRLVSPPAFNVFIEAMEQSLAPATEMASIEGFTARYPRDGEPSSQRTAVYFGRDDANLYVIFLCYDTEPHRIRALRSSRDRIGDEDTVGIYLDTYRDQRRAYGFLANAVGSVLDATWIEGQGWINDPDWEWSVTTAMTQHGYLAYFTIPFRTLSLASYDRPWGVMVSRGIPRNSEQTYWPPYSQVVAGRMTQAAELHGVQNLSGQARLSVSPYVAGRRTLIDERQRTTFQGGVDTTYRWNDALQLAVSIKPDFGQIESDAPQIATNQRFELFFPEKRPLLADSARFFQQPVNVFFSRRIEDLQYGAFATGRIASVGFAGLLAQDEQDAGNADIVAARGQYENSAGHSLGVTATALALGDASDRLVGIDGRLRLGPAWVADYQAAINRREVETVDATGTAAYAHIGGTNDHWTYDLSQRLIDEEFRPILGFVPRTGIRETAQEASWRFTPKDSWVTWWGPALELKYIADEQGRKLDWLRKLTMSVEGPNYTLFSIFANRNSERLTPIEFPGLDEDLRLDTHSWGMTFASAPTPAIAGSVTISQGTGLNFVPAEGTPPTVADARDLEFRATVRIGARATLDLTALKAEQNTQSQNTLLFDDLVARAKLTINWTNDWFGRLTLSYEQLKASTSLTDLEPFERFNVDLLFGWQPSVGRAWYVGINHDLDRVPDNTLIGGSNDVGLTPWSTRSRQLQTKFVYTF